jgi:hypothetical protein
MLQPRGYQHCFLFWRLRFQMSARKPAILTEGFCGFPQLLQANAFVVPVLKLGHDRSQPDLNTVPSSDSDRNQELKNLRQSKVKKK